MVFNNTYDTKLPNKPTFTYVELSNSAYAPIRAATINSAFNLNTLEQGNRAIAFISDLDLLYGVRVWLIMALIVLNIPV
jgi:hypothetical protein